MKKIFFALLVTVGIVFAVIAQEVNTMYVMKNGEITHQIAISDIDSVIFYKPAVVIPEVQLIFNETFGTTAVQTGTAWHSVAEYTGYSKTGAGAAQVSYAAEGGTVSVRSNSTSSGYAGASGSGNALMAAVGASLLINDIATCGATSLNLSFGSNETNSTLTVAYKINGTSNWVAIPYTKATTTWELAEDLAINLPAGTNTIKLKFTAATTGYGTRVDDITITTTNTIGAPIVDPDGAVSEGTGTKADPYSIKFALANQGGDKFGWIDGYIVGTVAPGKGPSNPITSNADISFAPPFLLPLSVVLAQTANVNDWTKVVVVELPAGTDIRGINLTDNAANWGKKLKVNGTLKKVWGAAGLVTDGAKANFEIEGGITPSGGLILNETFGTTATQNSTWPSVAEYTGYSKTGAGAAQVTYTAEGGAVSVRTNSVSSGYEGASGSCNAMMAAMGASLLINDIATCGATSLNLSFGSNETNYTLAVAYKINGTSNWVAIPYTKATTGWELVSDLKITLPAGTNTIKLKFNAGTTAFGTRVDDITITTTNTIGTPIITPDEDGSEPSESGNGDSSSSPYTVAKGISYQGSFGTTQKWVKGYIVGCVRNGKTTVSSADDIFIGVDYGWDSFTNVIIADTPYETDVDKCIIVNLPYARPLRVFVNLVDNPTVYQQSLTVKGVLRTYFGKAGLRDMTGETTDFILD